jgi:hypothetical protein
VTSTFKFDTGMDKIMSILKPAEFRKRLNLNIGKAIQLNAKLLEKAIRQQFQQGLAPKQSALQAWIKGSTKPGVDHGDLFKSVTSTKIKPMVWFVGVLKTSEDYNIAEIVHHGATIEVTPAMRGMFFMLWLADTGRMSPDKLTGRAAELYQRRKGEWKPLRQGTTRIVIPGRPYVTRALNNPALKKKIAHNFARAAQMTLGGKKS